MKQMCSEVKVVAESSLFQPFDVGTFSNAHLRKTCFDLLQIIQHLK